MTDPEREALVKAREALTHHRQCSIFDMAQQECDCGIGLLLYEIDAVLNAPAVTVTEGWKAALEWYGTGCGVAESIEAAEDGDIDLGRASEAFIEDCGDRARAALKSTTPQTGSQK